MINLRALRVLAIATCGVILVILLGVFGLAASYVYLEPALPSDASMRNVEMQVPLRVYTRSGDLIAEIGAERRIPVSYAQIPLVLKQAFLAAEDDRFFQHHGIDYLGLLRAVVVDLETGRKLQGASTITQQAARNMFLTLDKTWRRKLEEAFLTYRMEHEFTKQQIFGMYLNVIFFGERAYGVAAAAQTYFGKPLAALTLAEAATLAGLPQAPSRYDPIIHPKLAQARRAYVLRRMRDLGYVSPAAAAAANAAPIDATEHGPPIGVEAEYVAEMVRQEMLRRFGSHAETAGYQVYTTIDGRLQAAANRAVRLGLIEYDERHGYRGPVGHVDLTGSLDPERLGARLDPYPVVGILTPAIVTSVADRAARVLVKGIGLEPVSWEGLSWARRARSGRSLGPAPQHASDVVAPGDIVYVATDGKHTELAEIPQAEAALVALDPTDGAVAALVGGFDFFASRYNRAVDARRQPGSGFKPFLYSAALDAGFTPASILLDEPVVVDHAGMEASWRPENDDDSFRGPIRLREALVWSRNLASIRLLRRVGIPYVTDYAARFGFDPRQIPQNLTLALGTLEATPLQMASAYAIFANGGFRVEPYFIDRIVGPRGKVIFEAQPKIACPSCEPSSSAPAGAQPVAATQPSAAAAQPGAAAQAPGAEPSGSQPTGISGPTTAAALVAAANASRGGRGALPADRLAPRVISPQNDYLMTSMMADVIKHGTGQRALVLHRDDIAGKTGTSNRGRNPCDAWFNGYTKHLVATVWVGYDDERSLGHGEEGAHTALPIWIYFMQEALKGVPEERRPMPAGLVTLRISPTTGRLVSAENPDGILETFMVNHLPVAGPSSETGSTPGNAQPAAGASLF